MYYLTHAVLKDPSWGSDPIFQVEVLTMSTEIKPLQELIKSVYDSNFEEDTEEEYCALDLDYDLDFNYLMYFTYEDDGPKTHYYSICSGIEPKETNK